MKIYWCLLVLFLFETAAFISEIERVDDVCVVCVQQECELFLSAAAVPTFRPFWLVL